MKKAIAAIITDTHLSDTNIEVNKSIYRQATIIAKEHGLKAIEHGGDIFNSRKSQSQLVLTTFKDILDEMQQAGIVLNSCVGNHDKVAYSALESFLDPFSEHPAFNLYRYGGFRNIADGINLHYASFFSDVEYINQIFYKSADEKENWNLKNVLLTHIGIAGSVMNNGTVIESASITPSLFADYTLTLVGHFHDAQVLAEGKIRYIGASIQHNFGEMTAKGLTLLYDDLSTEIIPLKYPQYIKYEVNPKELTIKDIEGLKEEKKETGDNIRIILTGSSADVKSFNKQILIEAGVSVAQKTEDIKKEDIECRVEPFSVTSLREEFTAFCLKNNLDEAEGMKYFEKIILS